MKANPTLIALLLLILSISAYVGVVTPMSGALLKARTELTDESLRLGAVEMTITQHSDVKDRIARLEKENELHRSTLLSPMLNSFGMRAKSLIDDLATESGLMNVEYGEGAFRALPLPKERIPQNRTARQTVKIKATADYAAIASFLLRIEKELPLVALQSLTIMPPKSGSPDLQEMEMALEWPCEGRVIK